MFPHRTSKERLQNVKLSPFLGCPRSLAFLGQVRMSILHHFLVPGQRLKRSCVVPGGFFTHASSTLTAISCIFLRVVVAMSKYSLTTHVVNSCYAIHGSAIFDQSKCFYRVDHPSCSPSAQAIDQLDFILH